MSAEFEPQPVLTGDLLTLRPLRPEDFDALFAVASDPKIWEQHPAPDRHQLESFQAFFIDALTCGGTLIATDTQHHHQVIGSSRFHGYDPHVSEVEIGWTFLARTHWGGRYNGEMKRLMLEHALRFVDRVVLLVGPHNMRSQRAVEKIGGIRVGSRPDAFGQPNILYVITGHRLDPRS
jgi:RimJ/RimL family protein N-acetyltransferase